MDMSAACPYAANMGKRAPKLPISGRFDPAKPYNALPPIPPADVLETVPVLRKCVGASRALAGLKEAARLIPNQDVLINSIPLREARDSSAIENIVTTNDTLFKFASTDPEKADAATKEALRYRTALMQGFEDVRERPLGTRTAVLVCRTIKNVDLDIRQVPGTALARHPSGKVVYTPPEGQALLREKLTNLEQFLHGRNEIDPLIRMAAAHYQFEAIHPFTDGNGRTGRILNTLYLIYKKLLDLPVLYLSRHINEHRSVYYDRLLAVTTEGAWEDWLLYMLTAVEETSLWTTAKIRAIRDLMDATVAYVSAAAPKIYNRELIEVIFTQPYSRIGNFVEARLGNRKTASKHLKELVAKGVLEERQEGRENIYINSRFLALLTSDANDFKAFA
jgi:Fic family protein